MKKPGKLVIATLSMVAAAGALVTAGPAAATPPAAPQIHVYSAAQGDTPPAELIGPNGEKPTSWGVASFQKDPGPVLKASVGGGTWNYGTTAAGLDGKNCYSNYIHPSKKHSASVVMAGATDKSIANPDLWAKAVVTAGAAYTCNTYWGVY